MRRAALRAIAILGITAGAGCGTLLSISDDAPDPSLMDSGAAREAGGGNDAESGDGPSSTPDAMNDARNDGAADATIAPAAGCGEDAGCKRVVFVTSAVLTALEVAFADQQCVAAAQSAGAAPLVKGRNFRAWTSSAGASAASKLVHGTASYIRSDGTVVANDFADLTDGSIDSLIDLTEKGSAVGGSVNVWTGTRPDGTLELSNCANWTTTNSAVNAAAGTVASMDVGWTDFQPIQCSESAHIYCFEH